MEHDKISDNKTIDVIIVRGPKGSLIKSVKWSYESRALRLSDQTLLKPGSDSKFLAPYTLDPAKYLTTTTLKVDQNCIARQSPVGENPTSVPYNNFYNDDWRPMFESELKLPKN